MKTISEVHRRQKEINPNIYLVDTGSKNWKVAAMLQLQRQNVATTPQQRHHNPLIRQIAKTIENQN